LPKDKVVLDSPESKEKEVAVDQGEEVPIFDQSKPVEEEIIRTNKEFSEKALGWLTKKWLDPKTCPICHQVNWTVGAVFEMRPYSGGGLIVGGPIFPVSPVTCLNCGYTFFMNAVLNQILKPSAPVAPSDGEKQ